MPCRSDFQVGKVPTGLLADGWRVSLDGADIRMSAGLRSPFQLIVRIEL